MSEPITPIRKEDITDAKVAEVLPLLKDAVEKFAAAWDALTDLEGVLGREISQDNLEGLIVTAPNNTFPEPSVTTESTKEFLEMILGNVPLEPEEE